MDGRIILAFFIYEKHRSFIVRAKVLLDTLHRSLGLDGIRHHDHGIKLIVGHQAEDRRLTDTARRTVLVLDVHRKHAYVVIPGKSLLQETLEEPLVVVFFGLAEQHRNPFSTHV